MGGETEAVTRVAVFVAAFQKRMAAQVRGGLHHDVIYAMGMADETIELRASDLAALQAQLDEARRDLELAANAGEELMQYMHKAEAERDAARADLATLRGRHRIMVKQLDVLSERLHNTSQDGWARSVVMDVADELRALLGVEVKGG